MEATMPLYEGYCARYDALLKQNFLRIFFFKEKRESNASPGKDTRAAAYVIPEFHARESSTTSGACFLLGAPSLLMCRILCP